MDEGDDCNHCTLENCIPSTDGCAIDRLFTDAKQQACFALYACIRANKCVAGVAGESNPVPCWCGTAKADLCEMGKATADGPCAKEYGVAAESTDQTMIFQRFVNPNFAAGSATNLAVCRADFCRDACKIAP